MGPRSFQVLLTPCLESKTAGLCEKAIQNELQNPSWESPLHPLGHPCEHNLQFFQICSILGVPRCPQSSQTEPRWIPKINKIKQKLSPETSSEKATRHTVFKDAFQAEFTQNLEGPGKNLEGTGKDQRSELHHATNLLNTVWLHLHAAMHLLFHAFRFSARPGVVQFVIFFEF